MIKTVAIVALAAGFFAGNGVAIGASSPKIMAPTQPAPQYYVDLLGGESLATTLYYFFNGAPDGSDPVPAGFAGALAVGYGTGVQNLSVEGDVFYTDRRFFNNELDLTTASAMGLVKYTLPIDQTFSVFGAVGGGGFYHHDRSDNNTPDSTNAWVPGYQLQVGASAKVAANVRLLGEVRFEDSFGHVPGLPNADAEQASMTAVLVGAQFGF